MSNHITAAESKFILLEYVNGKLLKDSIDRNEIVNMSPEEMVDYIVKNIVKEYDKKLEEIYVPNVDFAGIEKLTQKTIEEIEKFEG